MDHLVQECPTFPSASLLAGWDEPVSAASQLEECFSTSIMPP